jgi:hypothetical protein
MSAEPGAPAERMKPNPLPSNPKFLDRVEHFLQTLTAWMIINVPGRPMLSGMATGLILIAVLYLPISLVTLFLTWHWK